MRLALTSILACTILLPACDSDAPSAASDAAQPNPEGDGKADGAPVVDVVATDEPLVSTTFKRMLCDAIVPNYGWDTVEQRDAFANGCTDHDFTVTEMTRSTLYTHADDSEAITLAMQVLVEFDALAFETSLVRDYVDFELTWSANVDSTPEGLDRDAIIQRIADEVGEYFWGEDDPETFKPLRFDDLPEAVQATARDRERALNDALEREWGDNSAYISDEGPFEILHEGQRVGYVVSIDYWIEDSLFDGGGATLYLNTLGDVVDEVEWYG